MSVKFIGFIGFNNSSETSEAGHLTGVYRP